MAYLAAIYTAVAASAVLVIFSLVRWTLSTLRPRGFPPGPPVIPGLGNLHQLAAQKPYLQFDKWRKQYGDIFSVKTGAGNLVVLNKAELVHELFDKRGAIYSNRPVSYILTKHVVYEPEERQGATMQYDEYYLRLRKALTYIVGPAGIKRCVPLFDAEAARLVQTLRNVTGGGESRQTYEQAVGLWSLAVPMVFTNGMRLHEQPGYLDDYHEAQGLLQSLVVPGAAPLVDVFPVLRYVPGFLASWRATARRARKLLLDDADVYRRGARAQLAQMDQSPGSVGFVSLLAKLLADERAASSSSSGRARFTDTELGFLGQAVTGAAADTTSAALKSLLLILAAFPDAQRRAQAEVDAAAGAASPPTPDHAPGLVYLRACLSEAQRWRPTTPSALPHVLTRDDTLGDYRFPAGTVFIANAWSMQRDAADYEAPDEFRPERWLAHPLGLRVSSSSSSSAAAAAVTSDGRRALYAFGSGRRQCPGEQLAFTNMMLAAAKILWAFDVCPPPGRAVDVSIETGFRDGIVTQPVDPELVFRLRDGGRERGIREDVVRADGVARELLG